MKKIFRIISICLPAIFAFFFFSNNIFAAVMSSTHYAIQSDDLTPAGSPWLATSSSGYVFRDTLGEVSTGPSNSTSYAVRAGYQEMQETYLTVSSPGTIALAPSIGGISGGTATANGAFYVITDNNAGFTMNVSSANSPAMILNGIDPTHYFDNYTAGTPTFGWAVNSAAKFGFTVVPGSQGGLATAFNDNGSVCGSGGNSGSCWNGFATTPTNIINTSSRTSVTPGEEEQINFQAEAQNTVLEDGTYQATIVTTVSAN